jgi:hypothetical protein
MNAAGAITAFFMWRPIERRHLIERLVDRWREAEPVDEAANGAAR